MSQQGPGGYGGGGPHGPPGGGGYGGPPPAGYPPPPPGGYGPPGGQPPGGYGPPAGSPPAGYGGPPGYGPPGAPPGYGAPQYGGPPPGGSPSPSKSPLLWVGIGCGALLLLAAMGGVVAFLTLRSKQDDAEKQIEIAASAVALGASAVVTPTAPATGVCAKTVACCQAIASKSGSNADLAIKACAAYANLSDAVCAQQYPALKQAATQMGGSCE